MQIVGFPMGWLIFSTGKSPQDKGNDKVLQKGRGRRESGENSAPGKKKLGNKQTPNNKKPLKNTPKKGLQNKK